MKNITTAFLLSLLFFVPAIALAGAGHSHATISGTEAQIKAIQKVKQLIDSGKIDKTWATIKSSSITRKDYGHGLEWVITFKNDKVSDTLKQTLYLFYSQDGHYLAANFDGS